MPASSPKLTLPPSEQVGADTTTAVTGVSYSDSFAQKNPGELFLGITDSSGTLTALNASGQPIAGSGSDSIGLEIDYNDLTAALNSLAYSAAASGSDDIHFDIWNQAGVETTGDIPVTVTASAGGGTTETWTGPVNTDWNTASNWSGGVVPTNGDTAIIPGVTVDPSTGSPNYPVLSNAVLSGATIELTNENGMVNDATVTLNDVTLAGGTLLETLTTDAADLGSVIVGGTLTVDAGATITAQTDAITSIDGGTVVNDGTIQVISSTDDTEAGTNSNLINNGVIQASGSEARIGLTGSVTNNATIAIGDGARMNVASVEGGVISFNGSASLALTSPMALSDGATIAGFGAGDMISMNAGDNIAYSGGTLDVTSGGALQQAVPLSGSYTLGNFELTQFLGPFGAEPGYVVYAPDGGFSGNTDPDIAAPASGTVTQSGTLTLGGVQVSDASSITISDASGTLYMNGASGSGTNSVTASGSVAQLNADLASLSYVAGAGTGTDTVSIFVKGSSPENPYNDSQTLRDIPVTITPGSSGPVLSVPTSETVSADAIIGVSGSYRDSFAQHNPGMLFIGVTDSTGTLSATDSSGHAVAGSGSNSIGLGADFADVNAILSSLQYTAGPGTGSDTIRYDIWNQAGVETTGSTVVSIGASGTVASAAMPAMYTH